MNNLQPTHPERHFPRLPARYQVWSWVTILASVLICLMVSWLYLRQSELFAIVMSIAAILLTGIAAALILAEQARRKADAALDLTERKRAELALQRSETLLKEMGRIAQIPGLGTLTPPR